MKLSEDVKRVARVIRNDFKDKSFSVKEIVKACGIEEDRVLLAMEDLYIHRMVTAVGHNEDGPLYHHPKVPYSKAQFALTVEEIPLVKQKTFDVIFGGIKTTGARRQKFTREMIVEALQSQGEKVSISTVKKYIADYFIPMGIIKEPEKLSPADAEKFGRKQVFVYTPTKTKAKSKSKSKAEKRTKKKEKDQTQEPVVKETPAVAEQTAPVESPKPEKAQEPPKEKEKEKEKEKKLQRSPSEKKKKLERKRTTQKQSKLSYDKKYAKIGTSIFHLMEKLIALVTENTPLQVQLETDAEKLGIVVYQGLVRADKKRWKAEQALSEARDQIHVLTKRNKSLKRRIRELKKELAAIQPQPIVKKQAKKKKKSVKLSGTLSEKQRNSFVEK